jgi:hypothetical protein
VPEVNTKCAVVHSEIKVCLGNYKLFWGLQSVFVPPVFTKCIQCVVLPPKGVKVRQKCVKACPKFVWATKRVCAKLCTNLELAQGLSVLKICTKIWRQPQYKWN